MNLVTWFLKANDTRHRDAALAYERSQAAPAAISINDAYRGAVAALDGPRAINVGRLETGEALQVRLDTYDRHNVILGATGSGKTRAIIDRVLQRAALGIRGGFECELFDPKTETFLELKKYLAAWWLVADDATRAEISRSVHVIDWTRDRITPTAPYDNSEGVMTDAYAAELHTRVTIEASDVSYTDSLRQLLFMWSYLLNDLRYPPNFSFALRFLRETRYRAHVLTRVKSPDVRQYFGALEHIMAKQTQEAFLRRLWAEQAFPEYRYATAVPPAQLDKLGLPKRPRWVLANFGTTNAQPASLGHARFRWHAIRRLLSAPKRATHAHLSFIFEEAPKLLAGSPEVIQIVETALATLRSANVSMTLCAQSLSATLPRPVVENILLNTHTWSVFQTRPDEAGLVYPHVLKDPADHLSDGERRREFERVMQSLPQQHFYFLAKGHPALLCRTPRVPDPVQLVGRSAEELLEVFDQRIAPRSMIRMDVAAELIAEWEADVVGRDQIAPSEGAKTPPSRQIAGLDQLRRILSPPAAGSDE